MTLKSCKSILVKKNSLAISSAYIRTNIFKSYFCDIYCIGRTNKSYT